MGFAMKKLNLSKKKTLSAVENVAAKAKIFSVSFRQSDLDEIEEALDGMKTKYGAKVSRNEIVRRATLAHIRFLRGIMCGKKLDYQKLVENINHEQD